MAPRYDLVIVGMGSAGMPAAEFAATLPLRVAIVERDRAGGDCLWTGCVPSKALLAASRAAHTMRTGHRWGLPVLDPEIDTAAVWSRVRAVRAEIAATDDDPARFARLGVEVIKGEATVTGPHEVTVGERRLRTRFVLVCTGSRPATPPIDGLDEVAHLTNEDVFELDRAPASLVVVGGGPVGVEMAQAMARLGVDTTILQRGDRLLAREEPELADRMTTILRADGVDVRLGVDAARLSLDTTGRKAVQWIGQLGVRQVAADEVLLAVGRTPNVEGLGLEELGVGIGAHGVVVDDRMRTTVPSVYAAGDVNGRARFTHAAAHQAVRAIRDMFFPGTGKASALVPWCTFTDPSLAHAGLTSVEARLEHGPDVEVHRVELARSDRARADGSTEGVMIAVTARGQLVGAHLLAPEAGEVIHELALAMHVGVKLTDLASLVHVYPTISTSVGQMAAEAAYARASRYHWLVRAGRWASRLRRR
ncbi:MAG TPA: FAD-dependent oxidoreductase [Acidimicrobiales bacterium]|nr:FAD-dependent oxidoreductase [Acidimicrobiales bacterium]